MFGRGVSEVLLLLVGLGKGGGCSGRTEEGGVDSAEFKGGK